MGRVECRFVEKMRRASTGFAVEGVAREEIGSAVWRAATASWSSGGMASELGKAGRGVRDAVGKRN